VDSHLLLDGINGRVDYRQFAFLPLLRSLQARSRPILLRAGCW
jgi:hypothetical protein